MSDVAVVLPTCRGFKIPEQSIPVHWIIVHDQQEREINDDNNRMRRTDIIAPDERLYGAKTSAIRQAGLDHAYDIGYSFVLTVDDDCELPVDWAERHVEALRGLVPVCNNTVPGKVIRGLPVGYTRPVGISHGLWSGVLDYPAWYQKANDPGLVEIEDRGWEKISFPFPMCGMNVGFRHEALPAVYFQHQFLRHDDIFAGWVAQRVLHSHGYGFMSGGAVVQHERASDPDVNLAKEVPGDEVNARLLDHVMGFQETNLDPQGTFLLLALHLARLVPTENDEINLTYRRMVQDMVHWATTRAQWATPKENG